MGDVIVPLKVRSYGRKRSGSVRAYFDTGAPYSFISKDVGLKMGRPLKLDVPQHFTGLGNGGFDAAHILNLEVQLKGFWCPHVFFVLDRAVIDDYALVGHDFMQKFGITVNPKRHSIAIDEASIRHAQKIRGVDDVLVNKRVTRLILK